MQRLMIGYLLSALHCGAVLDLGMTEWSIKGRMRETEVVERKEQGVCVCVCLCVCLCVCVCVCSHYWFTQSSDPWLCVSEAPPTPFSSHVKIYSWAFGIPQTEPQEESTFPFSHQYTDFPTAGSYQQNRHRQLRCARVCVCVCVCVCARSLTSTRLSFWNLPFQEIDGLPNENT